MLWHPEDSTGARSAASKAYEYVRIARPDHWIKNIFVVPGAALALVVAPAAGRAIPLLVAFPLAFAAVCLIASANYTINEFLDAPSDRHHPLKSGRPGALGLLDGRLVLVQYLGLAAGGLAIGRFIDPAFVMAGLLLLVMGLLYNVPPIRTKDQVYLDVLSESINNPIRFLLGWFVVAGNVLPPSSALLAYWMGGAFLMGTKRYSEYRRIGDPARAALYRRSFGKYTEQSLLLSSFFYALCSAFFIGIFLIKYRIEFILTFPLFAILFTWYLAIGLQRDSAAQAPERLYRETALMGFVIVICIVAGGLFFIDIPFLHALMEPYFIRLHF